MINSKSLLIGILAGGIVSAAATLLTTPKAGRDLRTDVKLKSDNAVRYVNQLRTDGVDLKEQITKTSKEGAALIKDLSADVKESIESWKKTVEPHQKNIQKYLTQIEESLKELEEKTNTQSEQ
ncbi:YtxH domain-containing protein [Gracilibacillus caseinilyticus]|uniref:YtxH domain-containing protein n=1 Tax=Gracilibacillus caseinilyticus TaxID=2932256 RepID=A0ABY4ES58_9BACI|nr:YtxH domain-containing protein [Gracilibacillus caseinilyticus]UOQ46805.1 YtxH domain-containing protein [Gracilibacillus caseinilyticus]